jgi:hypothetical protein
VIVRAHDWWARLLSGEAASTADIAQQENLTRRYVNQLLRLAFLDPAITKSILEGTQPVQQREPQKSQTEKNGRLAPETAPIGFSGVT